MAMIAAFLERTLGMDAFEQAFIRGFTDLPAHSRRLYYQLRPLWSVVETYTPACHPGQETLLHSSELLVRHVARASLQSLARPIPQQTLIRTHLLEKNVCVEP